MAIVRWHHAHNELPRGRAFRLKSSPALLLHPPFASLVPAVAPGIVIRDGWDLSLAGGWAYTMARLAGRGGTSGRCGSST